MVEEVHEKRRYFRVSDTISLQYKVVDDFSMDQLSHISDDVLENCSLVAALEVLNDEARILALRLERRDPEWFEYLKIIDTKINLIVQALTRDNEQYAKHEKHEVSLSGSGLAFRNQSEIAVGTVLELRMMLTSCLAVIVTYGRVVDCRNASQNSPEQPYEISVEYINMKEEDREVLLKHVVKKQLQQLRDKSVS